MAAAQTDPVARLRQMKLNVAQLVVGGLLFGIGLPIAMVTGMVKVWMTPLGFDVGWVMALFAFANCGVAWGQWRRARALERFLQGQAPRS
ncbi:MAG: hypothetical protein ACXWLB_26365 [Reyranella sp.]